MEAKTFRIPAQNMGALRDRLNKMNRRAKRLNQAALGFKELSVETHYDKETGEVHRFHIIEVFGDLPSINGWKLIASLNHDAAVENIVKVVQGEELPVYYRTASPNCDHCNKFRRRDDTFVLKNLEGEHKQVGRNCLADFLRSGDAGDIAARWELYFEALDIAEDFEERGHGGGGLAEYDLAHYLCHVQISIRLFGWKSAAKAKEDGTETTAWTAWTIGSSHCSKELRAEVEAYIEKNPWTEADDKHIATVIEWAKNIKRDNDYLHNLSVIAVSNYVTEKTIGFAASMIPAYMRAQDTEERKAKKVATSKHFGEVGKRSTYTLTLKKILSFESQWGVTNLHIMEDETGNVAIWFASGGRGLSIIITDETGSYGHEVKDGETFKVKATVKEHGEREGVKQTVLSRVKCLQAE